jgi:hypothetical protein
VGGSVRRRVEHDAQPAGAGLLGQEQVAAWIGFDLLEGAYDTRQFIRVLDGLGHQSATSR